MENTINLNGIIINPDALGEKTMNDIKLVIAMSEDLNRPAHLDKKKWLGPNFPLFTNSVDNADMFLTFYRFRNAHEELLHKLEVNQEVTEERDLTLVNRLFDMAFYPLKHLSLTQHNLGQDPRAKITKAYKEVNENTKTRTKRPFEITVELSNGKKYQLHVNTIISKFMDIKENFENLMNSTL